MASLWEQISQKLHSIVDRALDARSMALYDQYIRDVEAYRQQVEDSAARMYAGFQANKRHLETYRAEVERMDRRLQELLAAGETDAARILQIDLDARRQLAATTEAQIAHQEADYQRLLSGRQETVERLQTIQNERPAVESLLAVVRSGELMAQIELTLNGIAQLGEDSAAGRLAGGILRRFDEAEARWQAASARLGVDPVSVETEKAEIDAQLAERMRRLGLE